MALSAAVYFLYVTCIEKDIPPRALNVQRKGQRSRVEQKQSKKAYCTWSKGMLGPSATRLFPPSLHVAPQVPCTEIAPQ